MKKDKQKLILNAAIKVFALRGYHYATIEEIADEAGVSKGLIHFYFESKLDILLSVILLFSQTVNALCSKKLEKLDDPVEKLHAVFDTFRDIMRRDRKNLNWGHIVKEGLPDSEKITNKKLQKKHKEIRQENSTLQKTIDAIIRDGQRRGMIEKGLKPQVIRQVLGGASQVLYYGLSTQDRQLKQLRYSDTDVQAAMTDLIDKYRIRS